MSFKGVDGYFVVDGKAYYTIKRFAEKMDVSEKTIQRYIKEGKLIPTDPRKKGEKLLMWTTQRAMFLSAQSSKKNKTHRSKKDREPDSMVIGTIGEVNTPSVADVGLPEVEDVDVSDVSTNALVVDTDNFDFDKHKDCWIMQDEINPVRDPSGNPMMDWDKFKNKVSSLTIQFKLAREMGKYISKDEQVIAINGITRVLKTQCDTVPNRYGAVLIAIAETITGHEFTTEEQAQVRNALKKVPAEFWSSVQNSIRELGEGGFDTTSQHEQALEILRVCKLLPDAEIKFLLKELPSLVLGDK